MDLAPLSVYLALVGDDEGLGVLALGVEATAALLAEVIDCGLASKGGRTVW